MKLAVTICLAAALVAAPTAARAQDAKKGAAELLFKDGQQLLADGKTAEACGKFEESQRLDPAIGTLLNLARCYELDGRLATAWQTYLAAEKMARVGKDKKRANAAKDLAGKLEGRLPKLIISVTDRPAGLAVQDGGVAFDLGLLDLPVPVWHHHALLVEADAKGNPIKLAKRRGSPSLADRRANGEDGLALARMLRAGVLPAGISLG